MKASWTKLSALAELRALTEQAIELKNSKRHSSDHVRWLARTLAVLEEVFGRKSRYFLSMVALTWYRQGSFTVGGPWDPLGTRDPDAAVEKKHHEAYLEDLDSAHGLLLAAVDHLERADLGSVYEGKNSPPESSVIMKVINLGSSPLRKIIRTTPKNEKEVQEAFEALLVGAGIRYSREAERFEYSSKTYIPDFTVPEIDLAIEIKLCAKDGREKECIAEINDDIVAYRTKYGNILFIVYDVGRIRDVDRFVEAFEKHEGVVVKVVKQ